MYIEPNIMEVKQEVYISALTPLLTFWNPVWQHQSNSWPTTVRNSQYIYITLEKAKVKPLSNCNGTTKVHGEIRWR